MKENSGYF